MSEIEVVGGNDTLPAVVDPVPNDTEKKEHVEKFEGEPIVLLVPRPYKDTRNKDLNVKFSENVHTVRHPDTNIITRFYEFNTHYYSDRVNERQTLSKITLEYDIFLALKELVKGTGWDKMTMFIIFPILVVDDEDRNRNMFFKWLDHGEDMNKALIYLNINGADEYPMEERPWATLAPLLHQLNSFLVTILKEEVIKQISDNALDLCEHAQVKKEHYGVPRALSLVFTHEWNNFFSRKRD